MKTMAMCAALAAGVLVASVAAEAQGRRAHFGGPDHVVAESRFGHGTVSGPVRRARVGWEVRMPGGTWIPCRRSCSETLRVETVDFWENKGAGREAIDQECGLFGCLGRSFRF
jgi:hypothetical protein